MMFHFFRKAGTVKELDRIIAELNMNMQNNYKDAAQDALRELEEKFSELTAQGALNESQRTSYASILDEFKTKLKSYSHKAQKPYW
ncbi:MAG: hypothetical protein K1W23_11155 [Lachnospiraceae bacterium]|jgi:uncharacterized coiled-coil protein SlyX